MPAKLNVAATFTFPSAVIEVPAFTWVSDSSWDTAAEKANDPSELLFSLLSWLVLARIVAFVVPEEATSTLPPASIDVVPSIRVLA